MPRAGYFSGRTPVVVAQPQAYTPPARARQAAPTPPTRTPSPPRASRDHLLHSLEVDSLESMFSEELAQIPQPALPHVPQPGWRWRVARFVAEAVCQKLWRSIACCGVRR